jgi:hypothetical protein
VRIDSLNKTIKEYFWDGLEDLQGAVGGLIERAETEELLGHSILIDEEGLLKDKSYGLVVRGCSQPFAGDALIVGDNGERFTETNISIEAIEDLIVWFDY